MTDNLKPLLRQELRMEQTTNRDSYRIVVGLPREAETEVNELADDWTPILWNVQQGKDGPIVTCVLVSERLVRQAQLMAARQIVPR